MLYSIQKSKIPHRTTDVLVFAGFTSTQSMESKLRFFVSPETKTILSFFLKMSRLLDPDNKSDEQRL